MTVLVWFRRDLRLTDNPALAHALSTGETIVPVFIRDDDDAGDGRQGAASRWWLHGSLRALDADLGRRGGGGLVYRTGPAEARSRRWSRRPGPAPWSGTVSMSPGRCDATAV